MRDESIQTEEIIFTGATTTTTTPTTTSTTTTEGPPVPPTTTTTTTEPMEFCTSPVTCGGSVCSHFTNWDITIGSQWADIGCVLYGRAVVESIGVGEAQIFFQLYDNAARSTSDNVLAPDRTYRMTQGFPRPVTIILYPYTPRGVIGSGTVDFDGVYFTPGTYDFSLQLTS
jgi:hypothetical protein